MAVITRQANLGATLSEATSKLLYSGPCELDGIRTELAEIQAELDAERES